MTTFVVVYEAAALCPEKEVANKQLDETALEQLNEDGLRTLPLPGEIIGLVDAYAQDLGQMPDGDYSSHMFIRLSFEAPSRSAVEKLEVPVAFLDIIKARIGQNAEGLDILKQISAWDVLDVESAE